MSRYEIKGEGESRVVRTYTTSEEVKNDDGTLKKFHFNVPFTPLDAVAEPYRSRILKAAKGKVEKAEAWLYRAIAYDLSSENKPTLAKQPPTTDKTLLAQIDSAAMKAFGDGDNDKLAEIHAAKKACTTTKELQRVWQKYVPAM